VWAKIVTITVVLAASTSAVACAADADSEAPLTLAEALNLAAEHNKTIAAARLTQRIDAAGVDVARERPNPDLRFEETKETPRQSLTVIQPIELGKRGRRIAVARAAARSGEMETALAAAQVRADVRHAYDALAAAQRKAAAAGEAAQVAARVRSVADERFHLGDVARLDVLQAELAALQADNEATALSADALAARRELNALIGRAVEAPTKVVDDIHDEPLPTLDVSLSANLSLSLLDQQLAEAEAKAALARAQRIPDPTVEAAVTHDSPPDFDYGWRAAVSISFPLFTRHGAAVRVEEATVAKLRLTREAEADRLRGAVAAAWARADAQRQSYRRFREEILPRAETVQEMAEDSYKSGHTGLVALLQATQTTRETRMKAIDSAFAFESALADLERAAIVGVK
jgi:cobalt-zinc-cadmium efflux system outer membrane protein